MSFLQLVPLNNDVLQDRLMDRSFSFMGPISFEERSTAWARMFAKNRLRPEHVFLFDYSTYVDPPEEDREKRRICREEFRKFFNIEDLSRSVISNINAFAFNGLYELCMEILTQVPKLPFVIDLTCMTRVHLLALSTALADSFFYKREIYFCYSTPRSYGFQKGVFQGWRDTLIVPIGKRGFFKREGHARGLIFAGNYGERLSVALQEWEPSSGVLIYTREEGRPDLFRKAREVNEFIEGRLRLLRMPFNGDDRLMEDSWQVSIVRLDDLSDLTAIILKESQKAKIDGGPIVMYPFGPKTHTLAASIFLASLPIVQAWAVYPVPEKFDANYSVGIGTLHAYELVQNVHPIA